MGRRRTLPEPTYTDYLELRKSIPPAPAPQEDNTRFYADEGGALRSLQSDGTNAPVAGAGVLPDPTDDGDVLTVVEGEWAGAPGGGSMPGAPSWEGPYTITPADYADVVNGALVIKTLTDVPVLLLAAIANVITPFSGNVTPGSDGFYIAVGDPNGSQLNGDPEFQNVAPESITGAFKLPLQPAQTVMPAGGVIGTNPTPWLITDAGTPVCVAWDAAVDPDDDGEIDIYLCFAQPVAP